MVKKKPVFGAIPTLCMPIKAQDREEKVARPSRSIVQNIPSIVKKDSYLSFKDFTTRIQKLKSITCWGIQVLDDRVIFKLAEVQYLLPRYEIQVGDSLGFTISCFGFFPSRDTWYLQGIQTLHDAIEYHRFDQNC